MNYILILFLVAMIGTAGAATIDCNNCTDCSAKIQNASIGDTIRLTANIVNCSGHCIDFNGSDGITFDGGNFSIVGDSDYDGYGIYLSKYSNTNTIKNCNLSRFRAGIYMMHVAYNMIHNTTSSGNYGEGITMLYSTDNVIEDCVLEANCHYDFYFVPYMLMDCDNCLRNVTGSMGEQIGFYNETVHLKDETFAGLYICSADSSTLENVTIVGMDGCKNNGMRIFSTYNVSLSNVTSSDNFEGIATYHSTNVCIADSECNDNHHYNIFISNGGYNYVRNTTVCGSPQAGIYLYHTHATNLKNVTAMYNAQGILLDNSNGTTMRQSTVMHNRLRGLGGFGSYDNLVYDNLFNNEKDITGLIYGSWNVEKTNGTNIIGGEHIGGNYWRAYNGTDVDDNGFGDSPWAVGGGLDYLPLFKERAYICGDVDDNGYVSANDVVEAYRRAVDPEYNLPIECVADVDNNGYVSANDVVEIYRCAVDPAHILTCSC